MNGAYPIQTLLYAQYKEKCDYLKREALPYEEWLMRWEARDVDENGEINE